MGVTVIMVVVVMVVMMVIMIVVMAAVIQELRLYFQNAIEIEVTAKRRSA